VGKPNPVLTIWVDSEYERHPMIRELAAKGHTIFNMVAIGEDCDPGVPDLILHPAAHYWDDNMWDYLPAALVAARKRRKKK
jgi:hypothetical protein